MTEVSQGARQWRATLCAVDVSVPEKLGPGFARNPAQNRKNCYDHEFPGTESRCRRTGRDRRTDPLSAKVDRHNSNREQQSIPMTTESHTPVPSSASRSPLLLTPERSRLVIIDVQEKLFPSISDHDQLLKNIRFLLDVARILNVRSILTEQYPKGLGPTVSELCGHSAIAARLEKLRFSAAEVLCESEQLDIRSSSAPVQILLAGIETHICVQQTALDLISRNISVFLACDASGSRYTADHFQSVRRMEAAGVIVTTVESIAFEWCESAGIEQFRSLSRLVRNRGT